MKEIDEMPLLVYQDIDELIYKPKPIKTILKINNYMEKKFMNLKQIENLKSVVAFLLSVVKAYQKSVEGDGKVTLTDSVNFISPLMKLPGFIASIGEVLPELFDQITEEEEKELVELFKESEVAIKDPEIIYDALHVALELKEFIFKYVVKQEVK